MDTRYKNNQLPSQRPRHKPRPKHLPRRRKSVLVGSIKVFVFLFALAACAVWAYSFVLREMQQNTLLAFPSYIGFGRQTPYESAYTHSHGDAKPYCDDCKQDTACAYEPWGCAYHNLCVNYFCGTGVYQKTVPPSPYALYYFFARFGYELAVFYKNLYTGFYFMHNPDRVFFGASLSKITHALYVYTLAENGLIDMYAVHTFTASDHWGGTGVIRFKPAGVQFTTRELLAHSIIYSCNVAFRMLVRLTANAVPSYESFARGIYAYTGFVRDIISQNTSARDMAIWMYALHGYLESESRYGHYLRHDLMNVALTSHPYFTRWEGSFGVGGEVDVSLIQSDYPMARKYGWSINAFHDAAIIYANSPYILVVLTNMDRGAHELFGEISCFIQEFNRQWFDG